MIPVFRLCKSNYKQDLIGKGAELAGGRWNSKGTPILYTSESRALAVAELAVHIALGNVPQDYYLLSLLIPEHSISQIKLSDLTRTWNKFPYSKQTQEIGDRFISEGTFLVLKVPSAIVPGEYNYLINPKHREMNQIQLTASVVFEFDQRLFT